MHGVTMKIIIIIIIKLLFTEVLSQRPSNHQQTRHKYTCKEQWQRNSDKKNWRGYITNTSTALTTQL